MKIVAVVMIWMGLAVAALFDAPDAPSAANAGATVASVSAAVEARASIPKG